jgi:hypothetical protein
MRYVRIIGVAFVVACALGAPVAADAKRKPTLRLEANGETLAPGATVLASISNFEFSSCSGGHCEAPFAKCAGGSVTSTLGQNDQSDDTATVTESTLSSCNTEVGVAFHSGEEFKAPRHAGNNRGGFRFRAILVTTPHGRHTCEWHARRIAEARFTLGEPMTATTFQEVKMVHGLFECSHGASLTMSLSLTSAGHPISGVEGP